MMVLKNARIIDGTGAEPKENWSIVVEGTKIKEITPNKDFGPDIQVHDLKGRTVIPGLIEGHVHLAVFTTILVSHQNYIGYEYSKVVASMKGMLEQGYTAMRDCGGLESGFVKAQREGLIPGPRIQTCVIEIIPFNGVIDNMPGVGGYISPLGNYATLPGIPVPWANGPWECRAKVREMIRYGAEVIKVINNPSNRPHTNIDRSAYTMEELTAIVDEAHAAGLPVVVHSNGQSTSRVAVEAGADCVDHGFFIDDETLDMMAKKGNWIMPTYTIYEFHATKNQNLATRERTAGRLPIHKQMLKRAMERGVNIACGTDIGSVFSDMGPVGKRQYYARELELYVECGMTPMQAICAATRDNAKCLRWDDMIGTLEAGKEADLVVLEKDPLADISILQDIDNIALVMQAGKPFSGNLINDFPKEPPIWTQEEFLKNGPV